MADEERRLGDWLIEKSHTGTHAVCYLRLTSRLGLSSWDMARQVPSVPHSQAENVTRDDLFVGVALLCRSRCHLSIACIITYQPVRPTKQIHAFLIYPAVECCLDFTVLKPLK
jgi:hypothetical protein